jgi:hypothetical protein
MTGNEALKILIIELMRSRRVTSLSEGLYTKYLWPPALPDFAMSINTLKLRRFFQADEINKGLISISVVALCDVHPLGTRVLIDSWADGGTAAPCDYHREPFASLRPNVLVYDVI